MFKSLKTKFLVLIASLALAVPVLAPAFVNAQASITNSLCNGTNLSGNTTGGAPATACTTDNGDTNLNKVITLVINTFSVIVGFISVVMIIYGGFRYITSGGDSTKVGNGRNTILYALIGLVLVALAQIIVHFVLAKASTIT